MSHTLMAKLTFKCLFRLFLYSFALLTLFSVQVMAACVTPAGAGGDIIYNQSNRVLQWCDGTAWYAAGQIDPAGPNDGCLLPAGTGGDIIYNQAQHILQYCDGDHWQGINGGVDKAPDGFTFTDLTNQLQSTQVTSNIVTILGIASATDVTISGQGTPQFRINGGAWVTSGNISNGQTLQLRLTTNAALATANTATVIVGTVGGTWSASTAGADTVPDNFSFTDRIDIAKNLLVMSNTVTITGISSSASATVTGGGSPQISINGGAWVSGGTISNGQTLQVRLTSASGDGQTYTGTVSVGGVSDQWQVTTMVGTPCTNPLVVGCVAADGSIYTGLSPDGNNPMYTTRCDYGLTWASPSCTGVRGTLPWNNGTTTSYDIPAVVNCPMAIAANCNALGKANSAAIAAVTAPAQGGPHQAASYCENLTENGKSDWYLPTYAELMVLSAGNATGALAGTLVAGTYSTSSEVLSNGVVVASASGGGTINTFKYTATAVRCVRR